MSSLHSRDCVKGIRMSGFLLVFIDSNLCTFHTKILRLVTFNDSAFDSGRILSVLTDCVKNSTVYLLLNEQYIQNLDVTQKGAQGMCILLCFWKMLLVS